MGKVDARPVMTISQEGRVVRVTLRTHGEGAKVEVDALLDPSDAKDLGHEMVRLADRAHRNLKERAD